MRLPQHLYPYLPETPQPIAVSLGRVVRSLSGPERLEACLKAAETLTRYLAVISLASAAATRPPDQDPPKVEGFDGNLAFGTFEKAVRQALGVSWEHPLREYLRDTMRTTKKHRGTAGEEIPKFIKLRNDLGHAVTHVDELRAVALLEERDPIGVLIECIEDLAPLLRLPPLTVARQETRRNRHTAQVLYFVGEGEPIPNSIDLGTPVFEWNLLYLCTPEGLLPLSPGLALRPRSDGRRGIYLIDGITDGTIRYKCILDNNVVDVPGAGPELSRWLSGFGVAPPDGGPLLEPVICADGRTLYGFLRNETPPGGEAEIVKANAAGEVRSVADFEEAISGFGVGAAFRDIKFAMLQHGCRLEPFTHGVHVVQGSPARVLVVVQLQSGPALHVTLQLGAFTNAGDGTAPYAVHPGQNADEILTRLGELMSEVPSL